LYSACGIFDIHQQGGSGMTQFDERSRSFTCHPNVHLHTCLYSSDAQCHCTLASTHVLSCCG